MGFAASSVAKIAGVSPATLYIYFKNKEDLLVSTYVEIKQNFGQAMLADVDEELPIHDIFLPDMVQYIRICFCQPCGISLH